MYLFHILPSSQKKSAFSSLEEHSVYICSDTIKFRRYWNKVTSQLCLTKILLLLKINQSTLIGNEGFGLVQLIKMNFVPNILHLIVDELTV